MKKWLGIVLVAVFALSACATTGGGEDDPSLEDAIERSAADIAVKLPQGTRVAVIAFESPHENLSVYIMDELAGALVDGSLEVADRNNLEYVYKELNFHISGEVSDESAQSIGKFLGAKYVITGQLVNAGGRYRYRLNGINVETAAHESSTRLNVRNDRAFRSLFAAVQIEAPSARTANYGTGGASAAPKTAGTFLDRGILFASRGEYDMAIEDFTEVIALDPNLQTAWILRGRALYASVSYVTSVGENFSGVGTLTTSGAVVSEGRKAVYDRAIADYTQAIRLDPDNAKAYRERGLAYKDKGDYDRAIADFNRALRIDQNSAAAYNSRGLAYSSKKDYDRAIADFTQALRLDPNFGSAYNNRGLAHLNKGDYDRAVADCDQALRLDPNNVAAYCNRGVAYYDKGDYDRAIADYTQALRIDPNDVWVYSRRGLAHHDKGDYDRAIADYTQTLRLDPNDSWAYNQRGLAYSNKGDYDRAIADYTQALRIDPNDAWVYSRRGLAYHDKGDYDRAIADYTQALRLNPNDAWVYNQRGVSYHDKGDYDRAIADYTQALRIDPNYAVAIGNRGFAYSQKGQRALAIQDLERSLQLNPNYQWAKDRLREIRGW